MNKILSIIFCLSIIVLSSFSSEMKKSANDVSKRPNTEKTELGTDSLPCVFVKNHADLIVSGLRLDAQLKFAINQLPTNIDGWKAYREKIKAEIIEKAGVVFNHPLALNMKETGTIQMKGYSIRKITFQTRPGIYATANLYIPDGKGPFPAVIFMIGHWSKAKIDTDGPQAVGHSLALNGYVCLSIDPWGAGERATTHGLFEYHGANLGTSILDIGESLMGIQISDNIRGVDLLCSLPYVDSRNIGATGASGGGNQTMWLSSIDDRIKAAVPVVSVGTFESYIMRSNCICELLVDGLTFTEEAGVLALVAPRSIKILSHAKDDNPTFIPDEMIRSYTNAKAVFKMYGVPGNIAYQVFELTHGYMTEDREAMLGWFDLHLKGTGTGSGKKEIPFELLPEEKLMVFSIGKRDANVLTTAEYCKKRGNELKAAYVGAKSFDIDQKRKELKKILRLDAKSYLKEIHRYSSERGWDRFLLETSDNKLIPVLHLAPVKGSSGYVVLCNPDGKDKIEPALIEKLKKDGSGIAIVDLSGTGESISSLSASYDSSTRLHTLSRAELWLGKTVLGEWVKELTVVVQFLNSDFKAQKICIDASKEAALAGLFYGAVGGDVDNIILREAPVSYLFDNRDSVNFFSMGIHLPGILNWGDISLVAALCGKNIQFINPVSMSGNLINGEQLNIFKAEFGKVRSLCHQPGITTFNQ
jgi:hypothetical protein